MLLSVSVSRSSRVRVFFFGYGELDLGSESKFGAAFASYDVASCSSLSLFSSSRLKFFSEGGVIDSIEGTFSLSESRQSGSLKYFGLYSCSVGLGHGPESEVTLISLFLGVQAPGSFRGNCFPSLDGFFHRQNFSVTSQYPLPVCGFPFLFLLSRSEAQHLLVSHMRKIHSQSHIWSLAILPLLSSDCLFGYLGW